MTEWQVSKPVNEDALSRRQRRLLQAYDMEAQGARTDFIRALDRGEVEGGLERGENYHMQLQLSPQALTWIEWMARKA